MGLLWFSILGEKNGCKDEPWSLFISRLVFLFKGWSWLNRGRGNRPQGNYFAIAGMVAIALIFMLFTYITPRIPIFKDKNTGEYGAKWEIETMQ